MAGLTPQLEPLALPSVNTSGLKAPSISISAIVSDAGALYVLQAATYLFPVITLSYLARLLGPKGLGLVAFGQGIGGYLIVLIEYGFHLTLTRQVARNRSNPAVRSDLLAAVWAAKALLSVAALPVLAGFVLFGRGCTIGLALAILAWSVAQSFNLVWYLHGTEQVRLGSMLDLGGKVLTLIGILATVKGPRQILLVFVWQTVGSLATLAISIPVAYQGNRAILPSVSRVRQVLRLGWPMFVQRASSQVYPSGNAVVLGVLSTTLAVGLFSGPDRIIRGAVSILNPVLYAAYPRVSRVAQVSPPLAATIASLTILASAAVGAATSIGIYSFSATLVRLTLGNGFEGAIPIMRLLALIPFLRSLTMAVSLQWMIPFGFEREFACVSGAASTVGIALAAICASSWGALGAAAISVSVEALTLPAQLLALQRQQFNPAKALWSEETRHGIAGGLHLLASKFQRHSL
jgi:PST family polysaccharide transporter